MRYYPPADPCDDDYCLGLAEHEIVREVAGGKSTVVAVSCPWHVQSLWADVVRQHVASGDPATVTGFYVQRHVV